MGDTLESLETLREQNERLRLELEGRRLGLEAKAVQAIEEASTLFDQYVDPREPYVGENGELWAGMEGEYGTLDRAGVHSEADLQRVRCEARALARDPHARSVFTNYRAFILGTGITYQIVGFASADAEVAAAVEAWLWEWRKRNNWPERQRDSRYREDRDGEVFLRLFRQDDGDTKIRAVEPGQVKQPDGSPDRCSWGIETDPDDCETVTGYYIDGQLVPADEIQHRKRGTDTNVKRGLPLLYGLERYFRRIETTRRNMSIVFAAQASIAAIRKSKRSKAELETLIGSQADYTVRGSEGRRDQAFTYLQPGSILEADENTAYEFPSAKVDVDGGNKIIQSELRAIGSALSMPEYMISGDASNANYSSTLVAESPAVRNFEILQAKQISEDIDLIRRVLVHAESAGAIPTGSLERCEIQGEGPSMVIRDRLQEAQKMAIERTNGVLSLETWRLRAGYDNDTEAANIAAERETSPEHDPALSIGKGGN